MKFNLALVATLPAVVAHPAAYISGRALVADAEKSGCQVPSGFHVKHFEAKWNRNSTDLASLKFTYVNAATGAPTDCLLWEHSRPEKRASTNADVQFSCDNSEATFSWQSQEQKLTIIQQACPNEKGEFKYEASGSVNIPVARPAQGYQYKTASATHSGDFDTVRPSERLAGRSVERPRVIRKRGIAWSYDIFN